LLKKLLLLSRTNKKLIILFVDFILLMVIILASFSIRLEYLYLPKDYVVWMILAAPFIAIPIFKIFGLYNTVVRYIDFNTLWSIIRAVSLYSLIWGLIALIMGPDKIPRSVIFINWLLSIMIIGGIRLFGRFLLIRNKDEEQNKCKVLIYGAGNAGIQLVSALKNSRTYEAVGFIDDAKDLQGNNISGLDIFSIDNVEKLIQKFKVEEVLIALPSVSRSNRLDIVNKLEPYSLIVRMLPGLSELAEGKVKIDDLLKINIQDLLGRKMIKPNKDLLEKNITNKVVVVTGAGGSIGSELCRQIITLKPKSLILYEMSELSLYNIEKELSHINLQSLDVYPILGSVNNKSRLKKVFKKFKVETIYHAAAYKHVPMVEFNSTEGVDNNIFGTLKCVEVAADLMIETFVLISTDKAVRPTNTMGATKRVAELILQAFANKQTNTKFSIVRFGNVLGSSGSVIPLFEKQIKQGGPLTITDKNITRYFMTVSEAVELIIQAGTMGSGGDLFVLDMGKPVKIEDLAKKMIRLSGLKIKNEQNQDGDIEIIYTGLRPGEKLYEELLIGDKVGETANSLIMRAEEEMIIWNELEPLLNRLMEENNNFDYKKVRELLIEIVPGFKPNKKISDILYKDKDKVISHDN
jgi:FlaA1/EpsC-like NDP-sugar epimerase